MCRVFFKEMQNQQDFNSNKTSYPVDYSVRKHTYSTIYRRATLLFP